MNDVLPADSAKWEFFEETVTRVARQDGYRNMRAPIVEYTPLFVRSIGEVTDIKLRGMTAAFSVNFKGVVGELGHAFVNVNDL